jgi:hypothetical protein
MHTYRTVCVLFAFSLLTVGCDQDRYLSGTWVLKAADDGSDPPPLRAELLGCAPLLEEGRLVAGCNKWMDLNLGHFGSEVVGTIRLYDSHIRTNSNETACSETALCACQYIQGQLRGSRLDFQFRDCKGQQQLGTLIVTSDQELLWHIGPSGAGQTLTLVRDPHPPTTSDKQCSSECAP